MRINASRKKKKKKKSTTLGSQQKQDKNIHVHEPDKHLKTLVLKIKKIKSRFVKNKKIYKINGHGVVHDLP